MNFKMRSGAIALLMAFMMLAMFAQEALGGQPAPVATYPVFPAIQGKVYKFEKVADGVYYAAAGGTLGGNHTVIVNDHDVLLVDDGTTAANARDLLQDIKLITDKPIRYVVNTHFHYDHTNGNQIFGPEVEIIGQEYVRTAILTSNVLQHEPYQTFKQKNATQLASLPKQIAAQQDLAKKAELEKQLSEAQSLRDQLTEIKLTPPNVTYTSKMVLYSGSREIQFLFLGRAHTAGDTIVYLPKEKIVITGDAMTSNVAYMGDAYFDEWIKTLDELKKLDFTLVLPGHGRPFEGKGLITEFQGYIAELIKQVGALRSQGISPEDAAKRVDLTAYQKYFSNIRGIGAEPRGVRRMYQWMDQKGIK